MTEEIKPYNEKTKNCLFCEGDVSFMAFVKGVCVPCADKLQVLGIMIQTVEQYRNKEEELEALRKKNKELERFKKDAYKGAVKRFSK